MKKILLDTDIGPDCDDAGALALVNIYARKGYVDVLAVTHCTSSEYGVGAIRAIDNWYGHDFPVGTMQRKGFLDDPMCAKYSRPLAETLPPERRSAGDAVALMRRTLAAQEDNSVELISIGPLGNMAALLDSAPDELSPLGGEELAARKCSRITLMAGSFAGYAAPGMQLPKVEWNVEMDVAAAHTVVNKWHGEMVWCGWESGAQVITGKSLVRLPQEHPVRRAYRLHGSEGGRPSWDLLTVQHACLPGCTGTCSSPAGTVRLAPDGATEFVPEPNGRHRVVLLGKPAAQVAAEIDRWLEEGR